MEYTEHHVDLYLEVSRTQRIDQLLPDLQSMNTSGGRVFINYTLEKASRRVIQPCDGTEPLEENHVPFRNSSIRFITCRTLMSSEAVSHKIIASHLLGLLDDFSPMEIEPFVDDIIDACRKACCDVPHANRGTLPISVRLTLDDVYFFDERRWIDMETTNASEYRMIPASEKSVKELEIKNATTSDSCVICMEDVPLGTEAARMPCSHVFHEECIVNWLNNSHFCPICRFEMPIDNGNDD